MCRWLAYMGSPLYLNSLLFKPEHSLIEQSRHAEQTVYETNADGFGLGWYQDHAWPGVYRDIHPAWNDQNLRNLAEQIRSPLFLAHVRATSGTAIQRSNSHPFRHRQWLFLHNGEINEFAKIKQDLDQEIAPELYSEMQGSTDTERIFYLALTLGLDSDPRRALARAVGRIEALREKNNVQEPFRMTAAVTNGKQLFALRYSTHRQSPTLYHSKNLQALKELCEGEELVPKEGVMILSEPLDRVGQHWEEVPEWTLLLAHKNKVDLENFEPIME